MGGWLFQPFSAINSGGLLVRVATAATLNLRAVKLPQLLRIGLSTEPCGGYSLFAEASPCLCLGWRPETRSAWCRLGFLELAGDTAG